MQAEDETGVTSPVPGTEDRHDTAVQLTLAELHELADKLRDAVNRHTATLEKK